MIRRPFLPGLVLMVAALGNLGSAPIDAFHRQSCTTAECHPVRLEDPAMISHPSFLEGWCDRCHLDHTSDRVHFLKAEPNQLCLQCHTETETHERGVSHPPGESQCTECHSPHQSTVRHLLREESQLLSCSECHRDDLAEAAEKPYRHRFFMPVSECASCHYAHQSGEGAFLRGNLGETCLTCHDMSILVEGRHLERVGQQIREANHVHAPLADNACHACHTPHGSMQSSLLRDDYPDGNYAGYSRDNYRLCWTCHDPQLVEGARNREATGFRNGSVNLHNVHVYQSNRGRACHLCHTAHASERPHLIRETMTFGSWVSAFEFESLPDGGTCTTACHRPMEYNRQAN